MRLMYKIGCVHMATPAWISFASPTSLMVAMMPIMTVVSFEIRKEPSHAI